MSKVQQKEKVLEHPSSFTDPLCAEVGATFFFIDDEDDNTIDVASANLSYKVAIETCNKCSHIAECAAWGVKNERWGVWGGLTPPQRSLIRRKTRITVQDSL
jgi:hypothetical protein